MLEKTVFNILTKKIKAHSLYENIIEDSDKFGKL